jgi:glycosyltransferase involved in cell wall biosynthesis
MIQALKDDFDLTLLTWRHFSAEVLNRFQGTNIRDSDLKVLRPNPIVRTIINLDRDYGSIQPIAYLMRVIHAIRKNYDLVIGSGTEEMDLGGAGLVYIHFPHLARFWSQYRDCEGLTLWAKLRAMIGGATRPWIVIADYSIKRFRAATLVVNSDWTAEKVRSFYELPTTTLYPPAIRSQDCREWAKRENGFLCLGRITPFKRMDAVISILGQVRLGQPDLTLHLVGVRTEHPGYRGYDRKLDDLINANREWITLHEYMAREELSKLMGRMRYGIHANRDEHFGIAPAEMMASGCIVFVHNSGGQVEIVGEDPRLCFDADEDAIEKIASVVAAPALQASILASLAPRRSMFSPEKFMQGLRTIVDRAIERSGLSVN